MTDKSKNVKKYCKYTDIVNLLREHIVELRHNRIEKLENERTLSTMFSAGRPTIAKALKKLEEEKFIRCSKRGTIILPFKQKYRYAYVASLHFFNNTFWFPAYQHLWNDLERGVLKQNMQIDFIAYDHDVQKDNLETLIESLQPYDLIFISLISTDKPVWEALRKSGKKIIILDENNEQDGFPLYALDNRRVGEMAAEILWERGYRRTAIAAPMTNASSQDFLRRINGFVDTMRQLGGYFLMYSTNTDAFADELKLMMNCIADLPKKKYDSLFFLDDRWCSLADSLINSGKTPEFGIIALDGTMTSRTHNPPIDTISHGTIPLTEELCRIMRVFECDRFHYDPTERKRISPLFFRGKTLRLPEKK